MKIQMRVIIIVTVASTTLFWFALVVGFLWFASGGKSGARIQFTRPAEMDVFSGTYRVSVIASNGVSSSLLLSHTARAPEQISFTVEGLDTKTAHR
jgi:hypothetical protein